MSKNSDIRGAQLAEVSRQEGSPQEAKLLYGRVRYTWLVSEREMKQSMRQELQNERLSDAILKASNTRPRWV